MISLIQQNLLSFFFLPFQFFFFFLHNHIKIPYCRYVSSVMIFLRLITVLYSVRKSYSFILILVVQSNRFFFQLYCNLYISYNVMTKSIVFIAHSTNWNIRFVSFWYISVNIFPHQNEKWKYNQLLLKFVMIWICINLLMFSQR